MVKAPSARVSDMYERAKAKVAKQKEDAAWVKPVNLTPTAPSDRFKAQYEKGVERQLALKVRPAAGNTHRDGNGAFERRRALASRTWFTSQPHSMSLPAAEKEEMRQDDLTEDRLLLFPQPAWPPLCPPPARVQTARRRRRRRNGGRRSGRRRRR